MEVHVHVTQAKTGGHSILIPYAIQSQLCLQTMWMLYQD